MSNVCPCSFSIFVVWKGLSWKLKPTYLARMTAGLLESFWTLPSPGARDAEVNHYPLTFSVGSGDPSPDPHAYEAATFSN